MHLHWLPRSPASAHKTSFMKPQIHYFMDFHYRTAMWDCLRISATIHNLNVLALFQSNINQHVCLSFQLNCYVYYMYYAANSWQLKSTSGNCPGPSTLFRAIRV